ncbi:hypothetical protein BC940DRAFT_308600 [Gongronella butleri]|nr:hypothetical protein BC940DRAFT_308600 [Gongronella butleri]
MSQKWHLFLFFSNYLPCYVLAYDGSWVGGARLIDLMLRRVLSGPLARLDQNLSYVSTSRRALPFLAGKVDESHGNNKALTNQGCHSWTLNDELRFERKKGG